MSAVEAQLKELDREDHTLRNQIITEYLPYVNRIVNRIATHLPPILQLVVQLTLKLTSMIHFVNVSTFTSISKEFIGYEVVNNIPVSLLHKFISYPT